MSCNYPIFLFTSLNQKQKRKMGKNIVRSHESQHVRMLLMIFSKIEFLPPYDCYFEIFSESFCRFVCEFLQKMVILLSSLFLSITVRALAHHWLLFLMPSLFLWLCVSNLYWCAKFILQLPNKVLLFIKEWRKLQSSHPCRSRICEASGLF